MGERQGATRQVILATIAFGVAFSAWGFLAPIAPDIQDKLGLSNTQTAIMISIPVVLGSLLRIPFGLLTDRLGGRLVFGVMLFYSAAAAVLVGFATSYAALLGAGFLLGATGATFAIGIPFVAEWVPPKRQGFALGIYGVGNVGTAVAAFSVPAIRDSAGQEVAGLVFGAVIAAYALIWWSFARDLPDREPKHQPYMEVLRSGWELYRLALFYFVTFGGFVAMAIFLPKLLKDWFDYSLTDAGLRAAGFTLLATAARPIGGVLADRLGGNKVLVFVFIGVGLDAIGLSWQASDPAIVPGDDLQLDDGALPRPRQRRRVQAGAALLPEVDRRRDRHHRRRRWPRRLLPAAAARRRSRTRPATSCSASSSSSPSPGCARGLRWPRSGRGRRLRRAPPGDDRVDLTARAHRSVAGGELSTNRGHAAASGRKEPS